MVSKYVVNAKKHRFPMIKNIHMYNQIKRTQTSLSGEIGATSNMVYL